MLPPCNWKTAPSQIDELNCFVICKTPLSQQRYPTSNFTEEDLVPHIKRLNVGLVISLTMSNKYYSRKRLERLSSVSVRKIRTPGRIVPTRRSCRYFCYVVNVFRRFNPRKKILVHCTHGINRTGFLICYYLCKYEKMKPHDAIDLFASKRGQFHDLYRERLYQLFPSSDNTGCRCDQVARTQE